MFLPPVVLAIRSRYVLEAAVYTFTMFFSTVPRDTYFTMFFYDRVGKGSTFLSHSLTLQFEDFSRVVLSSK